jgi:hypothetical protein
MKCCKRRLRQSRKRERERVFNTPNPHTRMNREATEVLEHVGALEEQANFVKE